MKHAPLFFVFPLLFCSVSLWAEAPTGPPPAPVKAAPVQIEKLQKRIKVTGQLNSRSRSTLSTQVAGLLFKVHVEEGQSVKKGQLLAELDARAVEQELKVNQSLFKVNQSQLKALADLKKLQEEEVLEIEKALKKFPGSISRSEHRNAKTILTQTTGEWNTLKADQQRLQAERQRIQIQKQDHQLKAPFDGIIVTKHLDIGAYVQPGQSILTLIDQNHFQIVLDCPEALAGVETSILKNANMTLTLNQQRLDFGSLRISSSIDPVSKTFKLIADLKENVPGALDGASVEGEIPSNQMNAQHWIPVDAILKNDAGAFVYKAQGGPHGMMALPMAVRILYRDGAKAVIAPGPLKKGDLVIVEGNERLFPMMPVQLLGEAQ